jgi:L-ascorbate metabolism protein UlaG (beta-lactamase superfamily)
MQLEGKTILIDPVFSDYASPLSHFAEIGRKFSGFDLVFLDCGQYDKRWASIHMNPEETVQAAEDLQAKALLPAHVGKFTTARHPWDEPFIRIAEASRKENIRLLTPQIGEQFFLNNIQTEMSQWWKNANLLTPNNVLAEK